jgi:ribose 1,5-bisphosphokinase PhnN
MTHMRYFVVIVIGPSGVGKSTLLRRSLSEHWPGNVRASLIAKETTREPRSAAEEVEYTNVTPEQFRQRSVAGLYAIEYHIFGESYGIPRADLPVRGSRKLYMQTLPTDVAVALRDALSDTFAVAICLLEAPQQTVRDRLMSRGDSGTIRTIDARMQTAGRERRSFADHVIDASGTPDDVFVAFRRWLSGD